MSGVAPWRQFKCPFHARARVGDALDDRCRNLETLAGLLVSRAEPLSEDLAGGAGWLIEQEVRQVRALLDQLGKETR
ncbi:MAG: hypothetical protein FJ387_30360 [Verrucomicrobia bacterium]|nr:hypothetical protein [Verrucomicrobiota bacterium]